MAFTFGTAAPAGSPFPGGLFGAPAASSASAFGASTAPAFGAALAPAFGASSAPAFGANSAAPFGATAAPAFGAAPAAASPFGAPAAASPASGLFGNTNTAFGAPGLFGQPASSPVVSNALVPAGGLFGAQPQPQPAAQARPGLNYKTKFEELPPQMQQELQKIQQEISSYRDECRALDNDARLHDTVSIKQSLDSETAALRQTLQSLYQAAISDEEGLMAFRERVMVLMRSTESAIRLYQRSKLWREISQAPGSGSQAQQLLSSQAVQDQMSQPVQLPNPYLALAVRGFTDAIEQYHSCISELERVMPAAAISAGYGGADDAAAVSSLPTLVSYMHDYFVHVAARLERLHGEVARAREAYLSYRRARGDYSDPFADARPLHHMSSAPGKSDGDLLRHGGATPGLYSFGGPAATSGAGGASANGGSNAFGAANLSGASGAGTLALPAPGGAPATGGTAASPGTGGLFNLSPGGFGTTPSYAFNMPSAPSCFPSAAPTGAFGTPLTLTGTNQQQQQRPATRTGSSSSKKR